MWVRSLTCRRGPRLVSPGLCVLIHRRDQYLFESVQYYQAVESSMVAEADDDGFVGQEGITRVSLRLCRKHAHACKRCESAAHPPWRGV